MAMSWKDVNWDVYRQITDRIRPLNLGNFGARMARFVFRLLGWELEGSRPSVPKCVFVGAPHTSNWDLFWMFLTAMAFRLPVFFMMKHTLFRWPIRPLWRRVGGIPVDRTKHQGLVEQVSEVFSRKVSMYLVIAPEGTRKKAKHWKTGFYRIAERANVPVVAGYIDYARKKIGLGEPIYPSGDLEEDFKKIQAFFREKMGNYIPQLPPALPAPNASSNGSM
jgi:1-acyl-sn-glycerol-3-phosphate acyltransferase